MLNKENVEKLKAVIRLHPEMYDQNTFYAPARHGCGTVCCLAGWGYIIKNDVDVNNEAFIRRVSSVTMMRDAMEWLGIDAMDVNQQEMADTLFADPESWPDAFAFDPHTTTYEQAVEHACRMLDFCVSEEGMKYDWVTMASLEGR